MTSDILQQIHKI